MNGYIIYCNSCFGSSLSSNRSLQQYFITSCGKVVCQKCLPLLGNCNKCGTNCSRKVISNQMSPDMEMFFKDTSSFTKRILQAEIFQQSRYKQFIKYQQQKIVGLERMVQEKCNQIQSFQEKQNTMESTINKLKENLLYMQQKFKQSRHSEVAPSSIGQVKQSSFIENVMNAIGEVGENDTMGNSGIFQRDNLSRNSFDRSMRSNIIGKANPLPKAVTFEQNFNDRLFQSTPLAGHERQVPNFGFRSAHPTSILTTSNHHRPKGSRMFN